MHYHFIQELKYPHLNVNYLLKRQRLGVGGVVSKEKYRICYTIEVFKMGLLN